MNEQHPCSFNNRDMILPRTCLAKLYMLLNNKGKRLILEPLWNLLCNINKCPNEIPFQRFRPPILLLSILSDAERPASIIMAKTTVHCYVWLIVAIALIVRPSKAFDCIGAPQELIPCLSYLQAADPTPSIECCSGAQDVANSANSSKDDLQSKTFLFAARFAKWRRQSENLKIYTCCGESVSYERDEIKQNLTKSFGRGNLKVLNIS